MAKLILLHDGGASPIALVLREQADWVAENVILLRTDGERFAVLHDTNCAREFARDVRSGLREGTLEVYVADDPPGGMR